MPISSFLFAILTAILWGLAPVLEKAGLRGNLSPLAGVTLRSFAISIVALLSMVIFKKLPQLFQCTLRDAGFVILGGLIAGLLAQWTYYMALKQGSVSSVVPIVAAFPLVALVFSIIFLQEALSLQKIRGVVFVVAGVILIK